MLSISVVIVCLNEKNNICECLDSLLAQNYPLDAYEIIVVDNGSIDGTREIVSGYQSKYSNVRLILNPVKGIAGSRNMGLRSARFGYIAYTDADCVVQENWLERLANGFKKYKDSHPNLACVGGSNVPPPGMSRFYAGLQIFLTTYLGSHGSVQGMTYDYDQTVDHIPTINILYDKSVLIALNGFDITFGNIGEDQDLSYRLDKKGYLLYYLANTQVVHKLRPNFKKWLKNMFVYGKGRMWLIRKHPDRAKPVLLLPGLLVAFIFMVPLGMVYPLLYFPLLYFPVIFATSLFECSKRKRIFLAADLFILYVGTHFAYGLGEWYGLFRNRELYRNQSQEALVIS